MAQSTLMYYAYFRFYVDESEIIEGMNEYCTGWEHMFAVGYNYHEYKCFVDNLGGFEHWVGDMRGYISQTRETGFMDGSPGDSVYDLSLLMGASRIKASKFKTLEILPTGSRAYFRKIVGQDSGIAHKISMTSGDLSITHPVMYTFDSTQIEVFEAASTIIDSSDVNSYGYILDIPNTLLIGGIQDSLIGGGTVTDFQKMVDRNYETFGLYQSSSSPGYLHINMEETFTAISFDFEVITGSPPQGHGTIYTSPDNINWSLIGAQVASGRHTYTATGLANHQYIRIRNWATGGLGNSQVRVYAIFCI